MKIEELVTARVAQELGNAIIQKIAAETERDALRAEKEAKPEPEPKKAKGG